MCFRTKRLHCLVGALILCAAAASIAHVRAKPTVREIPLGASFAPEDEIALAGDIVIIDEAPEHDWLAPRLEDHLERRFGLPVRIEKRALDASRAYHADRGQWDGPSLARLWSGVVARGQGRIVVLTDKDIFAEGLNWTTGCAMCHGRVALVSICRLRPAFWGRPRDDDLLVRRMTNIAMHELGHTWGKARHCTNRCVLGGANSVAEIDALPLDYCPSCNRLAEEAVAALKAGVSAGHGRPHVSGRTGVP